jgi:hypothetical protein
MTWQAAFAALKSRRLDRVTRLFGWRLLHGGLRCGAAVVHWCPADSVEELQVAVCCPEPSCTTMLPMPVCLPWPASPIFSCTMLWSGQRWLGCRPCIVGAYSAPDDPAVPLDARVLLLGDEAIWRPLGGDAAQQLWLHLRAALVSCSVGRSVPPQFGGCAHSLAGVPVSAAAVMALAASWVERAIRLDWLRVSASLPGAAVLPSWCVVDQRFQQR